MNKLATVLVAVVLLMAPAAWAQTTQELPSAPTPVTPRFPGAPAQPTQKPAEAAPAVQGSPGDAATLSTLPPAVKAADAAPKAADTPAKSDDAAAKSADPAKKPAKAAPPSPASAFAPLSLPPTQKAAPAQQPPPEQAQEPESEFRIGVDVELVNLIFTATDKHGHFVRDLKRSDVRLMDEGKAPLRVDAFESETGLPLRVGLLIDASNSIRDRFRFEQDAAVEFLHQVVRPNSDLAFVVGFDSLVELTQDYTDNTDKLSRGVRVLRPGGGTALHDAIVLACEKLATAPNRGGGRRAIILLSDGDDNQSRHTREEAVEAALRAEVIIYVISTNIAGDDKKGDKVLMRYAEATGGKVFFPLRIEDVANGFAEIQDELRSQYAIAYKPQNFESDGRYRAIALDAPGRPGVKLRARKGYYAPKKSR